MAIIVTDPKYPDFSTDGKIYPEYVTSSPWQRLEPLLTAERIRQIYVTVPLVSFFPDPVTGKKRVWTDNDVNELIRVCVNRIEAESNCLIMPSEIRDTYPFDRVEYQKYGWMNTNVRPITALLQVEVWTADKRNIFSLPIEWVSVPNLAHGQMSILPGGAAPAPLAVSPSISPFLMWLTSLGWIPSFWSIHAIAGFKDGLIPAFVNDLIGAEVAIRLLGQLASTYAFATGGSLAIDGLSQSSSGPGPNAYAAQIAEMKELKRSSLKKLRKFCGSAISTGSV